MRSLSSDDDQTEVIDPIITLSTEVITAQDLHQPGIEPGSVPWQGTILPLDHWCLLILFSNINIIRYITFSSNINHQLERKHVIKE